MLLVFPERVNSLGHVCILVSQERVKVFQSPYSPKWLLLSLSFQAFWLVYYLPQLLNIA